MDAEIIPIVRARGVKKTYNPGLSNEVTVLKGVEMQAQAGEFVALIGQSGSGKSTLLNILGALDKPTEGTVEIDRANVATLDSNGLAKLRNHSIGFIFQFHYLLDEFTVLENALMPFIIREGRPTPEQRDYTIHLLERVKLGDQMKKRPSQLSGGQQQRNSIVRALAHRPKLVLADEPTGNLDSNSGAEVFALMREMNHELGTAFVMITHDDRLARQADRALVMEAGALKPASF